MQTRSSTRKGRRTGTIASRLQRNWDGEGNARKIRHLRRSGSPGCGTASLLNWDAVCAPATASDRTYEAKAHAYLVVRELAQLIDRCHRHGPRMRPAPRDAQAPYQGGTCDVRGRNAINARWPGRHRERGFDLDGNSREATIYRYRRQNREPDPPGMICAIRDPKGVFVGHTAMGVPTAAPINEKCVIGGPELNLH